MRRLRIWAGNPSLAVLGKRGGLARTTLHDALSPKRLALPPLDLVRRFTTACGCAPDEVNRWEVAWRSLHEVKSLLPTRWRSLLPPRQLPAESSGFVGRAEDLKRLDMIAHQWRSAERRITGIVVITGSAGVGKTALAVRWAHQAAEQFPDGQIYLNLDGFSNRPVLSTQQGLTALLQALGLRPDEMPLDPDAQSSLYRSAVARRRMLLVLDNAAGVAQIRPLLPGAPGCLVIVTSRHVLGSLMVREGARRLTLDRLDAAEAKLLLTGFLGSERVRHEEAAADELARLCAYLPLALRIAAANLADRPFRTITAYATELAGGDRLAALSVDGDDEAAVRAAFMSSYGKLEPAAQLLFRRLGLVPGPDFTARTAAVLTGSPVDVAARLLDSLAAAHLVEPTGPDRMGFHDLLRLFARELASEASTLSDLLVWYLHTAINAVESLRPNSIRLPAPPLPSAAADPLSFPDVAAARAWLDSERACLVAAVRHAAADPSLRAYAWLITDALRGYFQLLAPKLLWVEAAEAGLGAARAEGDGAAEAAMLACLGDAAWTGGDLETARSRFAEALPIARAAGDILRVAALTANLGLVSLEMGRLEQAQLWTTEAIAAYRELGDKAGESRCLARLGAICRDQGRLADGARFLVEAVERHRATGDGYSLALAVARLGVVYRYMGQIDTAVSYAEQALHVFEEMGDRIGQAYAHEDLASALTEAGRAAEAIAHATRSVALAREVGDRRVEADALTTLGLAEHRSLEGTPGSRPQANAKPGKAAERVLGSLLIALEHNNRRGEINAHLALAAILRERGDPHGAAGHAEQAIELSRVTGVRPLEARALTRLAYCRLDEGDLHEATALGRVALELHDQFGQSLQRKDTQVLLDRLAGLT